VKALHRLQSSKIRLDRGDRIKKWLFPVMLLVIIKVIYFFSLTLEEVKYAIYQVINSDISAQEENTEIKNRDKQKSSFIPDNGTKKWKAEANSEWDHDLIKELNEREAIILIKENNLKEEEERLTAIENEIDKKIVVLSEVEKKVKNLIETKKVLEDEKLLKLAKVFESTPPEQAGPLLSKLDIDIAAELILKMNSHKAGRIWGYVDPGKAVDISEELARLKPGFDINEINKK
jgi:flagellar motility protein MotE (MotC chaperone)